ncbi:MAG: DUF1501 domain-containing protein, partial [Planctomycetes bacterium]|nr:DUF1501 domain-containing protein [Planctomycetota bacterium]
MIEPQIEHRLLQARRQFLGRSGVSVGLAALASLFGVERHGLADQPGLAAQDSPRTALGLSHAIAKAKRVIYLMQSGAPSHVDLFDYKPDLPKRRGEELPDSVTMGQRLTTMTSGQKSKPVLPSISGFRQFGDCGRWVSNYLPFTGEISDRLCFVKSMHTDAINHAPAMTFLLTGAEQPGRPTIGAWATYGLGSDNENLPAYVVFTSRDQEGSCGQLFYDWYWGTGFLPTKYQGVKLRSSGDPVLYLSNPAGMSRDHRRKWLDALSEMNAMKYRDAGDTEIATRITQYEMAFRMQSAVPELADLSSEPAHILEMYGPDVRRPGSYAMNCLLARRLAERGVRFIQLMHSGWDQHRNLPTQLEIQCRDTDQPSAALVKDLAQRGLLDETLVIWGGEFGRTPFGQGDI